MRAALAIGIVAALTGVIAWTTWQRAEQDREVAQRLAAFDSDQPPRHGDPREVVDFVVSHCRQRGYLPSG